MDNRIVRMAARGAAIVFALALPACASTGGDSVAHQGKLAPDWTQTTSTGGSITLSALRGKPVYLNFFATWCGPCQQEAPSIGKLQNRYAARGLQVIGVDELESAGKAQAFRAKYHLPYPAVVDGGTLQAQYNVNGLPVHVFIARSGIIKRIVVGEMDPANIDAAIKAIL